MHYYDCTFKSWPRQLSQTEAETMHNEREYRDEVVHHYKNNINKHAIRSSSRNQSPNGTHSAYDKPKIQTDDTLASSSGVTLYHNFYSSLTDGHRNASQCLYVNGHAWLNCSKNRTPPGMCGDNWTNSTKLVIFMPCRFQI